MRDTIRKFLILYFGILASAAPTCSSPEEPIAATRNGTVVGLQNVAYDQDLFLGIPFAQPPVGNLRFRRPRSVNQTWEKLPATSYGSWCHSSSLQLPGFSQVGFNHTESEDCLTLNVVRPHGVTPKSQLPVLVYIYGGGLQEGGSADQRYNSSRVVQQSVKDDSPIIHVSFNHRISGFGFLAGTPVVESGNANLGYYDQRLALHWIQENIAAFGGDPSRVTIQGESAGAVSVGAHFLAFGGRDDGLFQAGIAQSGGPIGLFGFTSPAQQDAQYQGVLDATPCAGLNDTLQCLRGQPVEILKSYFQGKQFLTVIDDDIIVDTGDAQLKAGEFVRRPLLIGTNRNEGTPLSYSGNMGIGLNTTQDFYGLISMLDRAQGLSNDTATELANTYLVEMTDSELADSLGTVSPSPAPQLGSLYGRATTFVGDVMFEATRRSAAQSWTRFNVPVYSYHFDVVPNGVDPAVFGAAHFADVGFVFNNVDGLGFSVNPLASLSAQTAQSFRSLSRQMTSQWISFATTLSPNPIDNSTINWPLYGNGTGNMMVFQVNGSSIKPDTWRQGPISQIIEAFPELRV